MLVAVIVGFVIWAVKSGQFEDLERPGYRILDDDDHIPSHRKPAPTTTERRRQQDFDGS